MTSDKVSDTELFSFGKKSLKMIGRIDSVRMSMKVNQATGARETYYLLVGKDWGQVFESILYIDPLVKGEINSAWISMFEQSVKELFDKETTEGGLRSTSLLTKIILQLWGRTSIAKNIVGVGTFLNTTSPFLIPDELSKDLQVSSKSLSEFVIENLKTGRLIGYNKYSGDSDPETFGLPLENVFKGANSVWQILSAHICQEINELFCDLTWESDKTKMTLFKRVKPFGLDTESYESITPQTVSKFLNLHRTMIPKELILSLDCGDNWRDKINAIEVLPGIPPGRAPNEAGQPLSKSEAQTADLNALKREGLRPLFMQPQFFPSTNGMFYAVINWKFTFIDWYFNTHKMLNGNVMFTGLSDYITVGTNIMLDSSVFVKAPNVVGQKIDSKFVAHVESVSYTFSVDSNGARSYYCGVNFIRGVFANAKGTELLNKESFGIDSLATAIPSVEEFIKNTYEVK